MAAQASPISYAQKGFSPTILIHGNADEVVPNSESFNMYHALKKAGVGAELHIFDDAPHAFDAEPDFARQCVQLILLFFYRKVLNPGGVAVPDID